MSKATRDISSNLFGFYRQVAMDCGYDWGRMAGLDYVWNRAGTWPSHLLGRPGTTMLEQINSAMKEGSLPSFWVMEHPGRKMLALLEEKGIREVRQWKGMILDRKEEHGSWM